MLTGHDDGLITINIAEADSAERERRRLELGEPYRTLLGHLRHEVGHYYWDVLVRDGGRIEACRAIFGDESVDYNEALQRHYQSGAPADWNLDFVSAYATMHPVGGLRRDLDALSAHGRHPRHRRELRPRGRPGDQRRRRLGGDRASIPTGRATSTGWSRPGSR